MADFWRRTSSLLSESIKCLKKKSNFYEGVVPLLASKLAVFREIVYTLRKRQKKKNREISLLCTYSTYSTYISTNLHSPKKKIRQSNHLVISLKTVTFTKYLIAKKVWKYVNFRNVHTAQCGNCCNLVSHIFCKHFVKLTCFLKKLLKS